jgi:hypothetical protein
LISSPRCRRPSPEEVAYHEAGHVVVGGRLGLDLVEVDVEADGDGGNGHSVFRTPDWFDPGTAAGGRGRAFVENVITTFLAGTAAEAKRAGFENPESSGFDEDAIVRRWAGYLGPGSEAEAGLRRLRTQAASLVGEPANWAAIGRLAGILLDRRRLDGPEAVAAALGPHLF